MELEQIQSELVGQLDAADLLSAFRAGRTRQPALRPFETPTEVVAFLHDREPGSIAERSRVTRALLEELQRHHHRCWSTILLVAYFPGLLRARRTMSSGRGMTRQEVDVLVLEAFLEFASSFPIESQGEFAVANLVLGTQKRIRQAHRRAACTADTERAGTENIEHLLPRAPSPQERLDRAALHRTFSAERIRRWLRLHCGDASPEDLELLLRTYGSGVPLISFVREVHSSVAEEELLQIYHRYRRRRNRLIARLRTQLRPLLAQWPEYLALIGERR